MRNSVEVFTFSVLYRKHPFWRTKIKEAWVLSPRLYRSQNRQLPSTLPFHFVVLGASMDCFYALPFWIIQKVNKLFISYEASFCLKNYKLPNFDWTFCVTCNMNQSFANETQISPVFCSCFKKSESAVSRCSSK